MATGRQHGGSSTHVIELNELDVGGLPRAMSSKEKLPQTSSRVSTSSEAGRRLGGFSESAGVLPSPITVSEPVERWNKNRTNVFRTLSCFWSFIVLGANDAAVGALIPYLEKYYGLTYTVVSLVFLSPVVGYTLAALSNNNMHMKFGQRGIAILAPLCHMIAFTVAAVHPPFPALVVVYMIGGFGTGLEDSAWNAWIGNMANANELLGLLHGAYGLGATIAPLVATTMITKAGLPWWYYYYFMIGLSVLELATLSKSFWSSTGARFRAAHSRPTDVKGSRLKEALFTKPSARITWICTVFLMTYVGMEVALGGWIVTFMLRVRKAAPFAAGMTSTGFWLGLTIGRVVLGFVTPRLGENLAILIYIPITAALELLFWLVPQFYVSAVAVGLQGFFIGPLFPAAIVAVARLLPKHLHVTAIGFAAAAGGGGAALFPFAVGAIAQSKGVQVLQPIILALLATLFVVWLALPRMNRKVE